MLSILNRDGKKRGLEISNEKMDVIKVYNNRNNSQIKTGDNVTKQTIKFCNLGSTVSCDGGVCNNDIKTG
jgi:hypothetical protein